MCELTLDAPELIGSGVTHDLGDFSERVIITVANRWSDELADVEDNVYTRDLFKRNCGIDCSR